MKQKIILTEIFMTTLLFFIFGFTLRSQTCLYPEEISLDSTVRLIVEFKEQAMFYKTDKSLSTYQQQFTKFYNALDSIILNDSLAANKNMQYSIHREFYRIFTGISISMPLYLKYQISIKSYIDTIYQDHVVQGILDESVSLINADDVHNACATGLGVIIAIIDSGIDYNHEALGGGFGAGKKVIDGYDFVNDDPDPMDDFGHGTHVAGIVAANSQSIKGVAPGANLVAYKVLNNNNSGYESDVLAAIEASLDPNGDGDLTDHVDIVNLSLGFQNGSYNDCMSQSINDAVLLTNGNIVFSVAAGNEGEDGYGTVRSPGTAEYAITVASSLKTDSMSSFSSKGPNRAIGSIKPEITAPGSNIFSCNLTANGGGTIAASGTSMAAPHITGVCALLKEKHPDWTSDQIKAVLMTTSVPLYENGSLIDAFTQGAGRVDAYKAVSTRTLFDKGDLSFGNVNSLELPHNSSIDVEITNIHSKAQTYNLTISNLPEGVSITASETNFTIASGSSYIITFNLEVNSPATERLYSGKIDITGTNDANLHLTWAFVKNSIWWVDDDALGPNYAGTEADPKKEIQDAINVAGNHDYIFVKNGTYNAIYLSNLRLELNIASMYHFTQNNEDIEQTVITNSINGNTCYIIGNRSLYTIEGFSIKGDYTNFGLRTNNGSNCILNNCIFRQNKHALTVSLGSHLILNNCIIQNNLSDGEHGSGVASYLGGFLQINNSLINNNISSYNSSEVLGGSVSNALGGICLIRDTEISNDSTNNSTIYNQSYLRIENCDIHNNRSSYAINQSGGILEISESDIYNNNVAIKAHHDEAIIERTNIYNNSTFPLYFTYLSFCKIKNCLIANNSGTIILQIGTYVIENVTFTSNSTPKWLIDCIESELSMKNVIIYGNNEKKIASLNANISLAYSDIEDYETIFEPVTPQSIINVIDINPQFTSNYHLLSTSPCVDTGDPASDYHYEPMPHGCAINMGAYGNTPEAVIKDGAQNYAPVPYQQGFETGASDPYWQLTDNTVIQSQSGNGANGSNSWLQMNEGINETLLFVNLKNIKNPVLSFYAKTDSINNTGDGIYMADNCGGNFVKIADLPVSSDWEHYSLSIKTLCDANDIEVNESSVIMFKYFGNSSFYAIDELSLESFIQPDLDITVSDCDMVFTLSPLQAEYSYKIHYKNCHSGVENIITYENTPQNVPLVENGCYQFWIEVQTANGSVVFPSFEKDIQYTLPSVEDIQLELSNDYFANATQIIFTLTVTNLTENSYQSIDLQSDLDNDLIFSSSSDFLLTDSVNQIISTNIDLAPNESLSLSFTTDILDFSNHENTTCVEAVAGACSLSECDTTTIMKVNKYDYAILDNMPKCPGTYITHHLSWSDEDIPYTLIRDYGQNDQFIYNKQYGGNDILEWVELNTPGTYNIFAFFNDVDKRTQMNGTSEVTIIDLGTTLSLPLVLGNISLSNEIYTVSENINIKNGANLVITNCDINFAENTNIIVEAGGSLIIDGGTLTNKCGGLWAGIVVLGNSTAAQTEQDQGLVELRNGALIENALKAVYAGNPDSYGNESGAIVKIDSASIKNCQNGIYFEPYRAANNQNISYIKNSMFETTDFLADIGLDPGSFIYLHDVGPIEIQGNTFINSNPEAYSWNKKGFGINAIDAEFFARPYCSEPVTGAPCPEEYSVPNHFTNLWKAIQINGIGETVKCFVDQNRFENNGYGVYLNATRDITVTSNEFKSNISRTYGLMLINSFGFHIEDNSFQSSNHFSNGICVLDCKGVNEIYRNKLSNLNYGIVAEGVNVLSDGSGLQLRCNTFDNNNQHIFVKDKPGIATYQGSSSLAAGNNFYPECSGSTAEFYNGGNTLYYFRTSASEETPSCSYNIVHFKGQINKCPSKLDNFDYMPALALYQDSISANQTLLDDMIDGGNTEEMNEIIDDAQAQDALILRNELLSKSPNLSDTVMIHSTSIEDILPAVMLKQILVNNPSAAKSQDVQDALDNRANPLPPYMRVEIDQGKNIISYKEVLESNLSSFRHERSNLTDRRIKQLLFEGTTESLDTLKTLLVSENDLNRKYQLVNLYLTRHQITEAQNVFTSITSDFDLTVSEQNEYNLLNDFYGIAFYLAQNGHNWFDMSVTQKQMIENLSQDSTTQAGSYARSVLTLVDNMDYGYPLPDFEIPNNRGAHAAQGTTYPESFSVFPNPAKDYFILEYALSEKESIKEVFIAIFNDAGAEVKRFTLHKPANRFLIECENWEPGTYRCRKFVKGKIAAEEKVVVGNDIAIIGNEEKNNGNILGLNAIESEKYFDIYPNPAKDYFFIKIHAKSIPDNAFIGISDAKATVVKKIALSNAKELIKISSSAWEKGVYTVSIIKNNKILETHKIVIE